MTAETPLPFRRQEAPRRESSRGAPSPRAAEPKSGEDTPNIDFALTRAASFSGKAAPQSPYFTTVLGGKACNDPSACDVKTGTPAAVSNPTTLNLQVARIRIDHVTPDSGPIAGGTHIAIAGSDFTPQTKVTINGSSVAVVSQTPTELVVVTPPSAVDGPVDLSAGENSSTTVNLPNGFTYVAARRHGTRR